MSKINIYGDMRKALAGQTFGLDAECESFCAGEDFFPGDPVFGIVGDDKMAYQAHISAVTLTASANLVTGNSITVTVNGIAVEAVAFISSSANTIAALVTAINLNEGIRALGITASAAEGASKAFSLQGLGVTITASAVVTGGASQAGFTSEANDFAKFLGVARFEQLGEGVTVGKFTAASAIPVQTRGKIHVPVADDADPQDKKPAYVILTGDDAGKFTDLEEGNNYDCGCIFRGGRVSGDLALIELRGLK
jgi:hypothetical protein